MSDEMTPTFAKIAAAASRANQLVAGVPGKKIRVLGMWLTSNGAVNAKVQSNTTDLTGFGYELANTGLVLPFSPCGWFETAAGETLNLDLSEATAVGGSLVYALVDDIAQPAPAIIPSPPPPPSTPTKAAPGSGSSFGNIVTTLRLADGSTVILDESAGTARQSFTDALTGRTHTLTEVLAHYPWTMEVYRGGDVPKVVIGYGGNSTDGPADAIGYAHNYTARITAAGGYDSGDIASLPHFWGATWDHSLGEHTIQQDRAALFEHRLVPPFDTNTTATDPGAVTYSPMGDGTGNAGIGYHWGTTGDRAEIGMLTEYDAYYLVTGNRLDNVIESGRAIGTFPTGIRMSGLPMNLNTYPKLTTWMAYANWGPPGIALGDAGAAQGVPMDLDAAHHPHMGYLAYQLFREPYFLRRFQDLATYMQAHSPMSNHGMAGEGNQVRGDAWILLSLFYCYLASPPSASCPDWLLPREYWKSQLDFWGSWFDTNMIAPNANVMPSNGDGYYRWGPNLKNTRFHSASSVVETSFKEEYLGAVMGFLAWAGSLPAYNADMGGWVTRFQWKVQFCIDRSSGLTGWDHHYPDMYYIGLFKLTADGLAAGGDADANHNYNATLVHNAENNGAVVVAADWAEAWALNKDYMLARWTAPANAGNPSGIKFYPGIGYNVQAYMRMQLVYATDLGFKNSGLAEAHDWLVPQVTPNVPGYRMTIAA